MTLLLTLLLLGIQPTDCAEQRSEAIEAYTAASRKTTEVTVAISSLQSARDCLLASGDTAEAARMQVQEIYLLSIAGRVRPYEAAIDTFFALFDARHHLARYTYVMRQQATLDAARGNVTAAFATLHRCLTMTPQTWPRERAETHLRLAELYRRHNQYQDATTHLRAARTLIDHHLVGAERERQRVRALINLAETLLQWHALEQVPPSVLIEAREAGEQAYALKEYANLSDQIHVQHLLGDVLTYTGDTKRAAALLQDAVAASMDGDQYEHMLAQYRLGRNRLRAGDLGTARTTLEEAYDAAIMLGDLTWARRIRNDQARLETRTQNKALAKRHFREAIQFVEDLRAEIGTSEWAASSISDWQAPYRGLARVLLAEDSLSAALEVLEQSRARHLLALRARLTRLSSLNPASIARADSLMEALERVRNAIQVAPADQAVSLRGETATLQRELNELLGPPAPRTALNLPALQQQLAHEGRSVLYYVLDREDRLFPDEYQAYAFLIRSDTVQVLTLPASPDELAAAVSQITPALVDANGEGGLRATAFSLDALHALHETLIAPFKGQLPTRTPLTIIPDGPLFAVPFAALVTNPVGRFAYGQAHYLGTDHALTIDLSLQSPQAKARSETSVDVLAIGKSRFEDPLLSPLPSVSREISRVTSPFPHSTTLLNRKATKGALEGEAPNSRAIHFATHAQLAGTNPLYHALILSSTTQHDRPLHLYEIEQLNVQAELVSLSGCNTARGTLNAGEGMAGLQYAFRAVGARSTVSTLWSLSDEASADLFGGFYEAIADGVPKDVALQQAQQAYIAAHPTVSPFFWASPVLYGSPEALIFSRPANQTPWIAGIALLLLSLSTLGWHLHHRRSKAARNYAA